MQQFSTSSRFFSMFCFCRNSKVISDFITQIYIVQNVCCTKFRCKCYFCLKLWTSDPTCTLHKVQVHILLLSKIMSNYSKCKSSDCKVKIRTLNERSFANDGDTIFGSNELHYGCTDSLLGTSKWFQMDYLLSSNLKLDSIKWCGNFVERHCFRIALGDSPNNVETVPFRKTSTPENQVKFRYSS